MPRDLTLSENALRYLEAILRRRDQGLELTSPALTFELKPDWADLREIGYRIRTQYTPAAEELAAAGLLQREPLASVTGGEHYAYTPLDLETCYALLHDRYRPPRQTRSRLSPLAERQ